MPDNLPHRRKSIRLPGYDYSQVGMYFITLCAQNQELFFDNKQIKQMIDNAWRELKNKFAGIDLDQYVIMPNHLHGIVVINENPIVGANLCVRPGTPNGNVGADLCVCPVRPEIGAVRPYNENRADTHIGADTQVRPYNAMARPALGQIIQWFKTMTTNYYIRGVKTQNWPRFVKRLWQRNYWEHIIRNEQALNRIRQYIINNPANWANDMDNPDKM